jgi:high-affinity iron transporter
MAGEFLWSDVLAGSLIGFREAVEAALIIGVLMTWLVRSDRGLLSRWIWFGVGAGIAASLVVASLFAWVWGGMTSFEDHEAMFEGVLELFAALLLTLVIVHFIRHPSARELEAWADKAFQQKQGMGLFLISFLSVWREGSETVIFIGAGTEGTNAIVGVFFGIAVATVLAYGFFSRGMEIDISKLFKITNVLLILFAAGLVAHGFHELQEAGVAPVVIEEVWNVNPEVDSSEEYPLLHEKGAIGSIFKALFGWNGNPSLLEVLAWCTYSGGMLFILKRGSEHSTSMKMKDGPRQIA